jgi:digeranylgeranylglycerophospholipid reductase
MKVIPERFFEAAIIGGGPSGSSAAHELSKRGHSVIITDSRKIIGTPVNCGEALSRNTLDVAGLSTEGPWIVNRITGYRIRSPSGEDLFSSTEGFNIKRDIFDRALFDRAVSEGAEPSLSNPVSRLEFLGDGWKISSLEGTIRAEFLILACGVNIPLIGQALPAYNPIILRSLGAKIDLSDGGDELLFHVKGMLKGGYGWYFPRCDEVNIGVVTHGDPAAELRWLMKIHGIDPSRIIRYQGGILPVDGMVQYKSDRNLILVGDAGGFTNPISKGGIIGAVLSGMEGGKAVSDHLSGGNGAIQAWTARMIEHPAFTPLNLERRNLLASLDDVLLDELTSIARGRDIWKISRTEMLKETWRRPELIRSARGALRLIKGGREWARWAF